MTMSKERYKMLVFMDKLFPDMPEGLIVKVNDKRFRSGFYYGSIKKAYRTEYPFKVYLVRHLIFQEKTYWVFRDHIEIPEKGNKKELMKDCSW